MKNSLIIVLLAASMLFIGAEKKSSAPVKSQRTEKIINSNWTFNYFPDEEHGKGYEAPGYNDLNWPVVSIPHTWSTFETTGDNHPFIKLTSESNNPYWWKGWGWYRKHFVINEKLAGNKVFIEFEGVQKYCKVWLNGKYLGDHKGGYGSFDFDITNLIAPGKDNVLALAVSNRKDDQYNIPPMDVPGYNVYGGIHRNVKIVTKNKLYIPMQGSASHEGGTFITTPSVSGKQAIVRVQTWVKNDNDQAKTCMLNTYIIDAANKVVQVIKSKSVINPGQLFRFDQSSKPLKSPHLWSPASPYLYKVHSEVTDGSVVTDSYSSTMGVRWFRWDYNENTLFLNGTRLSLSAGITGQEYPWLGSALPSWLAETDLKAISDAKKYNLLLTSHYPNDQMVYSLTDRYGILVVEESPSAGDQAYSKEVQEQQVKEMIRRDRNHPSIFFWSMGSSQEHAADPGYAIAEDTTRIITSGVVANNIRHTYRNIAFKELNLYPFSGIGEMPASPQGTAPGEPARIVLSGSHKKMVADRASVVIVSAEIVDSRGVKVKDAFNTLKWEISGPARLAGPSLFESDRNRYRSVETATYSFLPVSNVIRLTGGTGKVKVTVSSSGLASGTYEFDAAEVKPDNSSVTEPVLKDEGRRPVARALLVIDRLEEVPEELKKSSADFNPGLSDRKGYKKSITEFIFRNNPSVDTATVEFRSLVSLFATYLINNNGMLSAGDYNFTIAYYNNCRLIASYITATKLPPLFKETLRNYYADMIITHGSEKNAGDEMNWMNWIPSGGTVIVSQSGTVNQWPKGTLVTDKDELPDIIAVVYPAFRNYTDEARQRALTFVSKMNPYVHIEAGPAGNIYRAERDKPLLIPLQKFIAM